MKQQPSWQLTDSDVTPESVYRQRRRLIQGAAALALACQIPQAKAGLFSSSKKQATPQFKQKPLQYIAAKPGTANHTNEIITAEKKATTYNNFYEFGTGKEDPAKRAQGFKVEPWPVRVTGHVENGGTYEMEDLIHGLVLEERIYRLRCVEAWSMVIPWIGFSLGALIAKLKPTSKAKYVVFETLYDPSQMPGQTNRFIGGGIDYPYVEGLTLAEANHPLTILALGMYGKTLPPQNGAPLRLVVPWKYGFKSIKSIARIHFSETQPKTTWNLLAPQEYGFYANVNPEVDHPRWSQASERRLTSGGVFAQQRIPTQLFNGYAEQVADLYRGIDLRVNY